MDYSRPDRADRLAAEYVLGTLAGPARRRFESLLPAHPALRRAVADWQRRLLPLLAQIEPVAPSPAVWARLQARLMPDAGQAPPWWQRLLPWQALSGLALAGMVALGLVAGNPPPTAPPVVVVLSANADAGALAASFVVGLGGDGRSLVLRRVNAPELDAARAFELWALPAQGAPRSLGLLPPGQGAYVLRTGLPAGTAALAVSLEPAGGSRTGAPTGPIVSVGKLPV